jgi:ribonuclease Z
MTASVRVLSVASLDSSPSLLFVAPDNTKILVDCGDGCQRVCLERGEKLTTIRAVCFTRLDAATTIGGFPGLLLTAADSQMAATLSPLLSSNKTSTTTDTSIHDVDISSQGKVDLPGINVIGPKGTSLYIHSLRHFVRRDSFPISVHDVPKQFKHDGSVEAITPRGAKKLQRKPKPGNLNKKQKNTESILVPSTVTQPLVESGMSNQQYETGFFTIYPIRGENNTQSKHLSYLFVTPSIPGKFRPDKAQALGIPSGPWLGQLKAGNSVTFVSRETGKEQTIESSHVVDEPTPSSAVLVWTYSDIDWRKNEQLGDESKTEESDRQHRLDLVTRILCSTAATLNLVVHWGNVPEAAKSEFDGLVKCKFPTAQHHLIVANNMSDKYGNMSPFHSALTGAFARSLLDTNVFLRPWCGTKEVRNEQSLQGSQGIISTFNELSMEIGQPGTEYVLLPRAKEGFATESEVPLSVLQKIEEDAKILSTSRGANLLSERIRSRLPQCIGEAAGTSELLFTGTGSAVPLKHRNVTGMRLTVRDSSFSSGAAMLLDAGEGTVGQLYLADVCRSDLDRQCTLTALKAVWISHPHADHHLGIVRLLAERGRAQLQIQERGEKADPLILIAPSAVFLFLKEFAEAVDSEFSSFYVAFDCMDITQSNGVENSSTIMTKSWNELRDHLYIALRITGGCVAVPVTHCPQSYAMILNGVPGFGRLVWSGDCRPSSLLAKIALGADLLIHEATFADGMEMEANLKRHSTVSEAIHVAQEMQAKYLVLTHFSQRYPKVPPLPSNTHSEMTGHTGLVPVPDSTSLPVAFAFDFMRLTPGTLHIAAELVPALRLLYSDDEDAKDQCESIDPEVTAILSIPGAFSHTELL